MRSVHIFVVFCVSNQDPDLHGSALWGGLLDPGVKNNSWSEEWVKEEQLKYKHFFIVLSFLEYGHGIFITLTSRSEELNRALVHLKSYKSNLNVLLFIFYFLRVLRFFIYINMCTVFYWEFCIRNTRNRHFGFYTQHFGNLWSIHFYRNKWLSARGMQCKCTVGSHATCSWQVAEPCHLKLHNCMNPNTNFVYHSFLISK